MPIDALSVLYAQLTRDLLAIAKFLLFQMFTVVECDLKGFHYAKMSLSAPMPV